MIGIKVQNLIWERALLELMAGHSEKYQENHSYDVVISESKISIDCPLLILGKDISIPFNITTLWDRLSQIQKADFENDFFKWLSQSRQLIYKKNKKVIQLTEKESEIINFLAKQPHLQATKEEILQSVWHYQNDIHTHTLESHIYALRQKLVPDTDKLITADSGVYRLIP